MPQAVVNADTRDSSLHSNFEISLDSALRRRQLECITALNTKYSVDQVQNHTWAWNDGLYLPFYTLREVANMTTIRELWNELEVGVDGHLSVSKLNEGWKAKWRCGN